MSLSKNSCKEKKKRSQNSDLHPVIESEILRGTVGAFAQSANFDEVGAEKFEGGHLNQYMHLKWTADGNQNTICKEPGGCRRKKTGDVIKLK